MDPDRVTPRSYGVAMETHAHASHFEPEVLTATAVPLPLPFDDESEAPVPFILTAAAHRGVLGRELPPLSVVPPVAEAVDTRPVQARALLRSGMPVPTIAAALGVDVEMVEDWTAGLVDELARKRRHGGRRRPASSPAPTSHSEPALTPERRERLLPGLVHALAAIDEHGVTLLHDRLEPVGVLFDALQQHLSDATTRARVALRVGDSGSADRVRAEVAARLGMDEQRIIVGRGAEGSGATLEIRVDIRDASAALLVRSWLDGAADDGSGLRGWDSNPQTFRLTADCSAS